jgi:hypothetical protein
MDADRIENLWQEIEKAAEDNWIVRATLEAHGYYRYRGSEAMKPIVNRNPETAIPMLLAMSVVLADANKRMERQLMDLLRIASPSPIIMPADHLQKDANRWRRILNKRFIKNSKGCLYITGPTDAGRMKEIIDADLKEFP